MSTKIGTTDELAIRLLMLNANLEREDAVRMWHSDELVTALRKLANEASGFLALSDIERHGMTNNRILRQRIEEARDAVAKAEGR